MAQWLEFVRAKIAPMAILVVIGYLGESGSDGGFIRDIWNAAKTASPFAAMFAILAWKDEQRERREAQRQCADRTVDFIIATNQSSSALEKLFASIQNKRGR